MRILILFPIVYFILIANAPLLAQQKHDTKIVVTATDTVNLFKRVALYLLDQGYTIENKYDDLQSLTTGAHEWTGLTAATYKIGVRVNGSEITFTGQMRLEVAILGTQPSSYDLIDYRPSKQHMYHKVWDWMETIAKHFGTEIKYEK
ncbi:MAG TPA: hypothetical protein VKI61_20335 [Chitinophagaceae bacterium]|jgi:hypothetical protein|nr:hypothetical protein [Chitinophagaceae bacterium]